MDNRPRFRWNVPIGPPEYLQMGMRTNFPVRPAPARLQAVKRPMPAGDVSTSMDVKRMRTASAVIPADVPASCASASSSVQNRHQNPVSVLNQYMPGLSYQLIGEYGPPHAKTFTYEVIVDEQVFQAIGESKASARLNVAQKALDALHPKIEAELERRKVVKQQKLEEKKARRTEYLKQQAQEGGGETGRCLESDLNKESPDKLDTSNLHGDTEQKPEASSVNDVGTAGSTETKPRIHGIAACRILKEIRSGISYIEKTITGAPAGHHLVQVMVDGQIFDGHGPSPMLARAHAAASALTSLFNIQFEYTTRGFPLYVGNPEVYMQYRQCNMMTAAAEEKNAISILNELYYQSVVYSIIGENEQGTGSCLTSVTVDGITAYGRGSSKKEAKLRAASAAVEQLRCLGLLQQRMTEKEVSKTDALTKLHRLYGACYINYTGTMGDFTVCLTLNDKNYTGSGRSKKSARLAAAEHALCGLNMWTAEDETAKKQTKQASASALVANEMSHSVNVGNSRGRGPARGVRSRGIPVSHDRGLDHGQSAYGREANIGRGTLLAGQAHEVPSMSYAESGHGDGASSHAKGSDKLRRHKKGKGGGKLERRAACTAAVHMEMLIQKCGPVNILNEIYQATVVYNYQTTVGDQTDEATVDEILCTCTVSIDGVSGCGKGTVQKEAKRNAASSVVEQLKASGVLQKRLADKQAFMAEKHYLHAVRMKKRKKQFHKSRAGRMQGGRGRSTRRRGRVAPVQGSRGRGVPGGTDGSDYWNPESHSEFTTYSDFTTQSDFMADDNSFYRSFDESTCEPANLTPSHFRGTANLHNRGQRRGQWLDFF